MEWRHLCLVVAIAAVVTLLEYAVLRAVAPTYYWVSPSGAATSCTQNDSSDSSIDPGAYMTLATLVAQGCGAAGDTIMFKNGTYTGAWIKFNTLIPNGTSSVPSNILCESDQGCIIAFSGVLSSQGVITADNVRNFRIGSKTNGFIADCGNHATGCGGVYLGITADGVYSNVTVEGILVRNQHATAFNMAETQPARYYDGVAWRYNENESPLTPYYTGDGVPHAMYIKGRNVTVEHSTFRGFNLANSYALHGFHIATGLTVQYNYAIVEAAGRGYVGEDSETNLVTNNMVYANQFRCPSASCGMAFDLNVSGDSTSLFNNVVDGFSTFVNVRVGNANSVFKNNVCTNGGCAIANAGTNFTCGGTCSTTNPTVTAATHFVNAAAGDYSLKVGSSLINAGLNVGKPFNGSLPDIGPRETFSCSSGTVTGNTLDVQCDMALNTPLQVGALAGWTTNNGRTVTAVDLVGSSVARLTFDGAVCAGETWTATYNQSPGTATDSAQVGGTLNQTLWDFGPLTATNNCGGAAYTFTQTAGGIYNATISQELSAAILTVSPGGCFAVRTKFKATGADPPSVTTKLQYSTTGAGGSYTDVPDAYGAGNVKYIGNIALGALPSHATPLVAERLTSEFSGMVAGAVMLCQAGCQVPPVDLTQDSESEQVDVLCIDIDTAIDAVYHFRRVQADGTVMTYAANSWPSVTVRPASAGVGY